MKKLDQTFVNPLRANAQVPVDPPVIGGKRETPPLNGAQVRSVGNVAAQFGASLSYKQPRVRR